MHRHNKEIICNRNLFRLVDGRRVWVSPPPEDQLMELLNQEREAQEWRLR